MSFFSSKNFSTEKDVRNKTTLNFIIKKKMKPRQMLLPAIPDYYI